MPRFAKEFDTYESATNWLYAHGLTSGVLEEMWPSGWVLTLEGDAAKRVLDAERPLAPGGFHLIENGDHVVQS